MNSEITDQDLTNSIQSILAQWAVLPEESRRKVTDEIEVAMLRQSPGEERFGFRHNESDIPVPISGLVSRISSVYFYYTVDIHWFFAAPVDSDKWWIGVYRKGAAARDYQYYNWVKYERSGTFKDIKLSSTCTPASLDVEDAFELRLFKDGYNRVDIDSGILVGSSFLAQVYPSMLEDRPSFRREPPTTKAEAPNEHSDLPSRILKHLDSPSATEVDRDLTVATKDVLDSLKALPKDYLAYLLPHLIHTDHDTTKPTKAPDECDPVDAEILPLSDSSAPKRSPFSNRAAWFSLSRSEYYLYPSAINRGESGANNKWCGVYKTQKDVCYNPDTKLLWDWVGTPERILDFGGYVHEVVQGEVTHEYVGAVFEKIGGAYQQIGECWSGIPVSMTCSHEPELPDLKLDFDLVMAIWCAHLSRAAYKDYPALSEYLKKLLLTPELELNDDYTGTFGFIASSKDTVYVGYRGTELWTRDILTDLWPTLRQIAPEEHAPYVHGGFLRALETVYTPMDEWLDNNLGTRRLVMTGHSLGGALATLAAFKYNGHSGVKSIVYTFGCPAVGDLNYSDVHAENHMIIMPGDWVADLAANAYTGAGVKLGYFNKYFQPNRVHFLPNDLGSEGHSIDSYISELTKLQPDVAGDFPSYPAPKGESSLA